MGLRTQQRALITGASQLMAGGTSIAAPKDGPKIQVLPQPPPPDGPTPWLRFYHWATIGSKEESWSCSMQVIQHVPYYIERIKYEKKFEWSSRDGLCEVQRKKWICDRREHSSTTQVWGQGEVPVPKLRVHVEQVSPRFVTCNVTYRTLWTDLSVSTRSLYQMKVR